ncbi:MAG: SMP-30/gluconolactonase/LRE family protein [Spirochaetota bacterium]
MATEHFFDYQILDERFRALIKPEEPVTKLYDGLSWGEGPCYFPLGDFLLFSDVRSDRMYQYADGIGARVFRSPSHHSNGNARDLRGRLVTCEHSGRRVTRTELDGSLTVVADSYRGKRLNSPNDIVVKTDGSIWFTDPTYGLREDVPPGEAEQELEGCFVFRLDPASGTLDIVGDEMSMPNGLAFSPDEKTLYVADSARKSATGGDRSGPPHILAFDVEAGWKLGNPRVFAIVDTGVSDGFRIDSVGNLWSSAGDGVSCFSPEGELLGKIVLPETVTNLEFGGPERNRLFITGATALYAVNVKAWAPDRPF